MVTEACGTRAAPEAGEQTGAAHPSRQLHLRYVTEKCVVPYMPVNPIDHMGFANARRATKAQSAQTSW